MISWSNTKYNTDNPDNNKLPNNQKEKPLLVSSPNKFNENNMKTKIEDTANFVVNIEWIIVHDMNPSITITTMFYISNFYWMANFIKTILRVNNIFWSFGWFSIDKSSIDQLSN